MIDEKILEFPVFKTSIDNKILDFTIR